MKNGKPKRQRVTDLWEDFERKVLDPVTVGPAQRQEMRRAFYAGAQSFWVLALSLLEPGEEATDADVDAMNALDRELKQFAADVRDGRA